ncbi:MAG TPA: uracil-DNA glycosylase [Casimicrobiaceae bacterium]|nr:uracil-DNA glycosylase [Casimicrobiaceae bacterium]
MPDAIIASPTYDVSCRRCARLSGFLARVREAHPGYHCAPVPPFGDAAARLVIVGLAPGLHGANATGRPFTGDYAGILLYDTLHAYGYASSPLSRTAADPLTLTGCRITNAVKCLPPENKPTPAEIRACNGFLAADLAAVPAGGAVLALGRIAHDATLAAVGERRSAHPFAHAARHELPSGVTMFDSYHCSRYNTNTGRLTEQMFRSVFDAVARHLRRPGGSGATKLRAAQA